MQEFAETNLVYKTVVGSVAYGLNTPESDTDIKGICIPSKEYYFGMKEFEQQEIGKDQTIYSIKKFFKLARDCNPNIIEMLYTSPEHIIHMDDFGKRIRDNANLFLSKKAKFTFSGYAFAQLTRIKGHYKWIMNPQEKPKESAYFVTKNRFDENGNLVKYEKFLEHEYDLALKKYNQYIDWKNHRNPDRSVLEDNHGYDTKHAMHLIRLLRMGDEITTEGQVNVLRSDRDELLSIRNGLLSYDDLIKMAEYYDEKLNLAYETSILPRSPDDKAINKLLISITEDFMKVKTYE